MPTVELNTAGLEAFHENLKATLATALKVGVLSSTNARDDGTTNADVGLKNEFGDQRPSATTPAQQSARGRGRMAWTGTPKRSFLRMPLIDHLPAKLVAENDTLRGAVDGTIPGASLPVVVGELAVITVQEAFDTAGFGTWPANSPRTTQWKGSTQPLIDTHQLRESIAFEPVAK
jgi:hypothetical protein